MIKRSESNGNAKAKGWTVAEMQTLRRLAREGTADAAAEVLGRTVLAVRLKAMKSGISFRRVQPAAVRERNLGEG